MTKGKKPPPLPEPQFDRAPEVEEAEASRPARQERRFSIGPNIDQDDLAPTEFQKQEYARRLYAELHKRDWSQADLARAAGVSGDTISKHLNSKVDPRGLSLNKIARAVGKSADDLFPSHGMRAIAQSPPSVSFVESPSNPTMVWLKINKLVTRKTGLAVLNLVEQDNVAPD